MKAWSYHAPRAPHVRTPRAYSNPTGAVLSPKQFKQKGGRINFRHTSSLGNTSVTVSRGGVSYSTHPGKGLPSISTGRRGSRSNMALGGGFYFRKSSGKKSR